METLYAGGRSRLTTYVLGEWEETFEGASEIFGGGGEGGEESRVFRHTAWVQRGQRYEHQTGVCAVRSRGEQARHAAVGSGRRRRATAQRRRATALPRPQSREARALLLRVRVALSGGRLRAPRCSRAAH